MFNVGDKIIAKDNDREGIVMTPPKATGYFTIKYTRFPRNERLVGQENDCANTINYKKKDITIFDNTLLKQLYGME